METYYCREHKNTMGGDFSAINIAPANNSKPESDNHTPHRRH